MELFFAVANLGPHATFLAPNFAAPFTRFFGSHQRSPSPENVYYESRILVDVDGTPQPPNFVQSHNTGIRIQLPGQPDPCGGQVLLQGCDIGGDSRFVQIFNVDRNRPCEPAFGQLQGERWVDLTAS